MLPVRKMPEADLFSDIRRDSCPHFFKALHLKRDKKRDANVHLAAEVDKGDELLGVRLPPVDHEHHVGGENKGHAVSTVSKTKNQKLFASLFQGIIPVIFSHSKHGTRIWHVQ